MAEMTPPDSTAKVRPCNCADPENCTVVPDGYELRCKRLNPSSTAKVRRVSGWLDTGDDELTVQEYVLATDHDAALAERDARIAELEQQLKDAQHKSFQAGRISYRGFSYGVGSQWGIDSLRDAIKSNGDG